MLVATCISLQHSSTKHYFTPQNPLKSKQMSCALGRTLHLNHQVQVLRRDAAGSKGGETVTTEASRRPQCVPPAAPRYRRQRHPRRSCGPCTHAQGRPMPRVLHAATGMQPGAGGSEMAQPLSKPAASGLAVPVLRPRQAGVRAITVQRPGGEGLSTKRLPSIQLHINKRKLHPRLV